MSEDEIVACFISFAAMFGWTPWYRSAVGRRFALDARAISIVLFMPFACALILLTVLMTLAADDVRNDPKYIFMYMLMGIGWVGMSSLFFGTFGISVREDVAERHNRAAAIALAGALVGTMLAFAGGNVGNGPGWWVVAICAFLSTAALFALWMLIELTTGVNEWVTVERDRATALRFAGLLIALGLILGRAVAGDWDSIDATLQDFWRVGRFAVLLAFAGIIVERALQFMRDRSSWMTFGLIPSLAYVTAAVWYVVVSLPRP